MSVLADDDKGIASVEITIDNETFVDTTEPYTASKYLDACPQGRPVIDDGRQGEDAPPLPGLGALRSRRKPLGSKALCWHMLK